MNISLTSLYLKFLIFHFTNREIKLQGTFLLKKKYYAQLLTHRLDNLDETDQSLKKKETQLIQLTQLETDNLNNHIVIRYL